MNINKIAAEIHENNIKKGFFEGEKNIGEMLALIHSEVSEALEADRKDRYTEVLPTSVYRWVDNDKFKESFEEHIKDSFQDELADIFIRVLDLAAFKNVDLEGHVKAKMRYNSLREYKHGKKY
jgi:NTP pyrophosphatase (non-canonical NTP hydrolase)